MWWMWIILAAVLLLGAFAYWRRLRRNRSRMLSFVGLLRESVCFDAAILATAARKAWTADLGDGTGAGADGFVAGEDTHFMIQHDGHMVLVNNIAIPYTDNSEAVAKGIRDLRLRAGFLEHRAWFSVDAMGVDGATTNAEVVEWQRRLGKLFAELVDENCLVLFLPVSSDAFTINDDTDAALRSDNPMRALQDSTNAPLVEVPDDDPAIRSAVERARSEWPMFVEAFETGNGENFSVKAPVTYDDVTEFIWIEATSLEGDRVYGKPANNPIRLGPMKLGSKVSVAVETINDWTFVDSGDKLQGGFSIEAVTKASRRARRK
jgi:uncharacterized protein YegJ (DUF2314 family)